MKPEQRMWLKKLSPILPARGHYTRIESEISEGFPDVHGTIDGGSFTLELKVGDGPKKHPLKGKIRTSQKFWIRNEVDAGGRVWVVAEIPRTTQIMFLPGKYTDTLETLDIPDLENIADLIIVPKYDVWKLYVDRLLRNPR